MSKLNILFVITSPSGGGAERNTVSLTNLLVANGYRVVIVCTDNLVDRYGVAKDVPLLRLPYKDHQRYEKLSAIIKEYAIEVVILPNHWLSETFEDIKWFKSQGLKVIAQEHSMFFFPLYTGHYSLFKQRLNAYKLVDVLTCLSAMDLNLWRLSGVHQVRYVQNLMTKLDDKASHVKKFNERSNSITIVGRLTDTKGLFGLPSYLEKILKKQPGTSIWILGDFSSSLEKFYFFFQLRKKGIANSIHWKAFTTNPFDYIERSKLLFLPSFAEGSPMVILEARQLGTPCMVFGLNYLDNGHEGVLHVNSDDSFLSKVSRILTDEDYWNKYSVEARENLERWDERSVLSTWEKIFADLKNPSKVSVSDYSMNQDEILAMQEFYKSMEFLASTTPKSRGERGCFRDFRSFLYLLKGIRNFFR